MGVLVRYVARERAWYVFVNHLGRRKAKKCGDKQTAIRVAQGIRESIARGQFQLSAGKADINLQKYSSMWLEHMRGNRKASTLAFYEAQLLRHILPILGDVSVRQVDRATCREFADKCRANKLRLATVRGILRTLTALLSAAVEDGLIAANPALRLGRYLGKGDDPQSEIQPLTRDESRHVLETAHANLPEFYPLLLTALRTGMRQSELLGLQWSDVHFDGNFIEVRRAIVRGKVTTPKNHQVRRVDMSDQLSKALKQHRAALHESWWSKGKQAPVWVFPSRTGTARDEANVRHTFQQALKKAGARHIRFHDLRHTFASQLIENGESLAYVKQQMGHGSIQITVDTYGHLVPGTNRQAVNRLDDLEPQAPASPAQVGAEQLVSGLPVNDWKGMVSLNFASWNRLEAWLRQVDRVRRVA